MRMYLSRSHAGSQDANLPVLRRDVAQAAQQGCEIVLFPEVFLTGYKGQAEPQAVREVFAELSAAHPGLLCVFGTLSEDGVNRLPVYLGGQEVAHYDKVHLFEPNGEQLLWQPGSRYVALRWRDWRIGLLTCNDIRFPEQARALKLAHDVDLLLCPAYWPLQRDHIWSALLRARAIENACFAAGCCIAGVDNGVEQFDGAGNHVFGPLGEPVYPLGRVYELDRKAFDAVLVNTRAQYREVTECDLVELG